MHSEKFVIQTLYSATKKTEKVFFASAVLHGNHFESDTFPHKKNIPCSQKQRDLQHKYAFSSHYN